MDTRRDFLKKATLLSGMTGMQSLIPDSIRKALAIDPSPGSSWMDAEHVVILMQENRSFDHAFGTLRGVRGFNDPRAIQLPNGNPVWLQSNKAGETYAPFRLDIKDTKATWMSSLPHAWANQVGARNDGRYDQWLNEKRNGIPEYADMPLTMGYYNRRDIPFYYELADGFTVCDQHFCSALTGTTPNRLFFWTGTIRAEQNENSRANVWNEDAEYESLHWKTFPEILEEQQVSWKMYQNEISIDVGFEEEEEAWLANYGDNPMEYFSQYHVRLHAKHLAHLPVEQKKLEEELSSLQKYLETIPVGNPQQSATVKKIEEKKIRLKAVNAELKTSDAGTLEKLTQEEKDLHRRAFVTNVNDPDYHTLEKVIYDDNGKSRQLQLPKGDILHQFREDVKTGQLPTVSWLTAPACLSDHPSYAWFGAWYVSEVMDILTQNPEVWKKTIFILTYDENDGYFDHVPPFVAPHSERPETGLASGSMDTRVDFVTTAQEKERKGFPVDYNGESPVGLGYRVPLVIASPWSRGGYVNSEIFDHTSTLQFLEKFLTQKTGKPVQTPLISEWRRAITGDLTSAFRAAGIEPQPRLSFLKRDPFMESVYNAKFKKLPGGFKALSPGEIEEFRKNPYSSAFMPEQEKGIKHSCGLAYELYAEGQFDAEKNSFEIRFEAGNHMFGKSSLGSAFNVYAPGKYLQLENGIPIFKDMRAWAFAVKPGDGVLARWPLKGFQNNKYHLRAYGPNGFFREFLGSSGDPVIDVRCMYQKSKITGKLNGHLNIELKNRSNSPITIEITDHAYKNPPLKKTLHPAKENMEQSAIILPMDLSKQYSWYDFSIQVAGNQSFERRYAGRVETGETGFTDPYMGRTV